MYMLLEEFYNYTSEKLKQHCTMFAHLPPTIRRFGYIKKLPRVASTVKLEVVETNAQMLQPRFSSCLHSCGSRGLRIEPLGLNEARLKTGMEIFEDESTMPRSLLEFVACVDGE